MNFCKAYLLSFLAVFLLSATKTVVEATQSQEDSDSNPAVKSSQTSTSSCYDFTMDIHTGGTPDGISWEIKNENTNEIIASQDEGFYTESTLYTHDELICLDMDNSDICYKVVVRDTSEDYNYAPWLRLSYYDEEHNDEYVNWPYVDSDETYTFCGFDDLSSWNGCLYSEPEPSCACGDIAYCVLESLLCAFLTALIVVCFPCWFVPLYIFLFQIYVKI